MFENIPVIIGYLKELKSIYDKIQDTQVKMIITNLIDEMANLKIEIADYKTEKAQLLEKIHLLEENIKKKEQYIYNTDNGFYYSINDEEKKEPYCPLCWEKDKLIIHLRLDSFTSSKFECLKCNVLYPIR